MLSFLTVRIIRGRCVFTRRVDDVLDTVGGVVDIGRHPVAGRGGRLDEADRIVRGGCDPAFRRDHRLLPVRSIVGCSDNAPRGHRSVPGAGRPRSLQ